MDRLIKRRGISLGRVERNEWRWRRKTYPSDEHLQHIEGYQKSVATVAKGCDLHEKRVPTHNSLQPFPQHRQERQTPKRPPSSSNSSLPLLPLPRSPIDLTRERPRKLDPPLDPRPIESNERQPGKKDEDRTR